jgi:hypothetical protein
MINCGSMGARVLLRLLVVGLFARCALVVARVQSGRRHVPGHRLRRPLVDSPVTCGIDGGDLTVDPRRGSPSSPLSCTVEASRRGRRARGLRRR